MRRLFALLDLYFTLMNLVTGVLIALLRLVLSVGVSLAALMRPDVSLVPGGDRVDPAAIAFVAMIAVDAEFNNPIFLCATRAFLASLKQLRGKGRGGAPTSGSTAGLPSNSAGAQAAGGVPVASTSPSGSVPDAPSGASRSARLVQLLGSTKPHGGVEQVAEGAIPQVATAPADGHCGDALADVTVVVNPLALTATLTAVVPIAAGSSILWGRQHAGFGSPVAAAVAARRRVVRNRWWLVSMMAAYPELRLLRRAGVRVADTSAGAPS
jgi:hypothetical protein